MSSTESKSEGGKAVRFSPASRLNKFLEPTVWHEFTPLASKSKAVNLGQGFPGWSPPEFVRQAGSDAIEEKGGNVDFMVNQYARPAGHLSLVNALAKKYSKTLGREVDPLKEIVVTVGATEAIFASMQGLIQPGDEVVALEPAFDIYIAQVEMVGGKLKTVPLKTKTNEAGEKVWTLDFEDLKKAFTPKTRALILNTPHNPTGKVFTRAELERIAEIVRAFPDCVVVADEVYEHLVYDGREHTSIATLPGMWDRTITVSSAGKTFSTTGWKVGWTIGPAHLVRCIEIAHSWISFSVHTPAQEAIARALETAEKPYNGSASYYAWLLQEYVRKRKLLGDALAAAGIEPVNPEGSFFIMGDTSKLQLPDKWNDPKFPHDWNVCRWLTVDIGVCAIPPSSFYCEENKPLAANLARFAFCKPDEVLQEAATRLSKLRQHWKA